jgi:hypothetical protein
MSHDSASDAAPDRLTALYERLRAYDESAMVALANRGLYRRALKDLEQETPSILSLDGEIAIAFAGQQVRITSDDPRSARCNCRAPTACQHRLAALIWLQQQAIAQTPAEPTVSYDALLAIGDAELKAHAGTAGFRWALNYAADLDLDRDFVVNDERYPVLRLPRLAFELRCLNAELSQMIVRPPSTAANKYAVAALLALRRAQGQMLPILDEAPSASDAPARLRMLAAVAEFVSALVDIGIAHPSPSLQQQADTLASWAQAVGCPRLAAAMRRCADQIEASCARLAHSDSEDLLDDLALAFGLAEALQHAIGVGRPDRGLLGNARRSYEESDALQLVGLAAWPFATASGFKGLTVLFYAPDDDEFLTLTDARAASALFDPIARLDQGGPWRGMACPRAALGAVMRVTQARRADDRLSGSDDTLVDSVRPLSLDDPTLPPAIDDWSQLADIAAASILRGNADRFLVLKPARWLPAQFDPHRQVLHWAVFDRHGAPLTLTLSYSALHARAVAAFERYSAEPAAGLIVVRRRGADLEPLGWLQAEATHWRAGTPYVDQGSTAAVAPPSPAASAPLEPPALLRLRGQLQACAERGRNQRRQSDLAALHGQAEKLGLIKLAALLDPQAGATAVLRSWLFLRQLRAER